jgi:hypothetical protein
MKINIVSIPKKWFTSFGISILKPRLIEVKVMSDDFKVELYTKYNLCIPFLFWQIWINDIYRSCSNN